MESKSIAKIIKRLLILQILIVIGIGICETVQLIEIDKSQQPIINNPKDWDYLFGYTDNLFVVIARVYYWIVILISIGILGSSLKSFEKRWENIQVYNDNSKHITMLVLWCVATVPSITMLSTSNGMRTCSESSYTYPIPPKLLHHCNAYLTSLLLAYILIFTIIAQLLIHFVMVKHQKKIHLKKQQMMMEKTPKLTRIRRSRRVSKKRNSLKSNSAFSTNSTRLSIVTEDEEENTRSNSAKSNRSDRINGTNFQNGNNNDKNLVYSNV